MPSKRSPKPPERCFTRWSRPRTPGAARPRPHAPEPELRRASVFPEGIPTHLAEKLNIKKGMKVRVVGKPAGVDLDDVTTTNSNQADAMLVFVTSLAEVDALCDPVVEAAMEDRLALDRLPESGRAGHRSQSGHPLAASPETTDPRGPPNRHRRCL